MALSALELVSKKGVEFVDLMYADLTGGWHHVTVPVDRFTRSLC
jgi:glutamine synthetase